jgi:rhodanese-related sulfurtransferase
MTKAILIALFSFGLFAFENIDATQANIKSLQQEGITIVDIRRKSEWIETGIVEGVKTLTFFNKDGGYNAGKFLKELDKIIDKNKRFAIICRTSSRTKTIAPFLDQQGYKVINLAGGITKFRQSGGRFARYK